MSDERWHLVQRLFEQAAVRPVGERAGFLDEACREDDALRADVESLLDHDERAGQGFLKTAEANPDHGRDARVTEHGQDARATSRGAEVPPRDGGDPFARRLSGRQDNDDDGFARRLVGRRIGRYTVKSVIATGGMGTVYLAEQEHPRREVALKVLKAGIAGSGALRRFEFESAILARLRHPNIAQVYEAGVHTDGANGQSPTPGWGGAPGWERVGAIAVDEFAGRDSRDRGCEKGFSHQPGEKGFSHQPGEKGFSHQPGEKGFSHQRSHQSPTPGWGGAPAPALPWFAMEFIPDARTIAAYAREAGLSIVERVKLFADVCDAVHHGHQKGVIHRDLKPANILVDAEGRPKVIDFGVARGTDSDVAVTTMHTDAGQIIGTLAYMSPEQCAADARNIDTRSDVYALGVVLYELVCERPPYDVRNATIHAAARIICEQEPDRPRQRDRRVPRDLETVLLKALEKDREKRYASAGEFRADLLRFVRGEPVEARPPTWATRAVRWAIRRPALVTAGVCLFIGAAVLGGTALATWWYNFRPYRFEFVDEVREARLLSFGGRPIRTWTATLGGKISVASIVRQHDKRSGRRLAIMGFGQGNGAPASGHPNSLCAYDADGSLDEPVWERHIEDGDVPEQLLSARGFVGREFGVHAGLIADVFATGSGEPAEDEIVAIHQHAGTTHSALRIYDLGGTVLYQVWLDVSVGSLYWMRNPGLLIVGGANGSAYWPERGHPEVMFPHPMVVFAVRPRRGLVETEYLAETPGDGPLHPVWYLCMLPPSACDVFEGPRLVAPGRKYDAESTVEVFSRTDPERAWGPFAGTLDWIVNEFGDVVAALKPNDPYLLNQANLPDPASIYWGPLPPIVAKREP